MDKPGVFFDQTRYVDATLAGIANFVCETSDCDVLPTNVGGGQFLFLPLEETPAPLMLLHATDWPLVTSGTNTLASLISNPGFAAHPASVTGMITAMTPAVGVSICYDEDDDATPVVYNHALNTTLDAKEGSSGGGVLKPIPWWGESPASTSYTGRCCIEC